MAQKKISELQLISSITGTVMLAVDNGLQSYRATSSQIYDYVRSLFKPLNQELCNIQLNASVAASALTIAIKSQAGSDASSTDKIRVAMRSATLTSGAFAIRELSSALSLVISSGSTLGQTSAQPSLIYVYLIDNAGTLELAASHKYFPENALVSTTAEGGAGAADSATVMYSTTARSNVACRLIGMLTNTQATAGTWATAPSNIQLATQWAERTPTVQVFTSGSGTYYKPPGCKAIKVTFGGSGGGGGSSGTAAWGAANDGAATTFGSSLLTANGGIKGTQNVATNAAGGTVTINSPALTIVNKTGDYGEGSQYNNANGIMMNGGKGGSCGPHAGGAGGVRLATGISPGANTGGGGGGGGGSSTTGFYAGGGGGGAGYGEALITDPLSAYAYAVAAAASGGSAGTSGSTGATSGSGFIIVEEFY